MSAPFLEADCVGKSFGARRVLSAASLRAHEGEVRVLLGRNGIGKSTLMRIMSGLMWADTGSVRLGGAMLGWPTLPRLARAGLFLLPDHDLLSPFLTLREQFTLFARRFDGRTAEEAAALASVTEFLDRRPPGLSGGELRRAELALALVRRPHCLVADEPFRGIAPIDHDLLSAILRGMAAEGCAVIVSGHEVRTLVALADHITWCVAGTTHELGAPAQALTHDSFRRDYAIDL